MEVLMGRPIDTHGKASVVNGSLFKRLLNSSNVGSLGKRNTVVILISYLVGLRAKEIASLNVNDIYETDGKVKETLILKGSYTKGSKTRTVFLSNTNLRRELKAFGENLKFIEADSPLIRTKNGNRFSSNGLVQLLRCLHHKAGISKGSSHSGRRTMITTLVENGVDLKSVSVLAGHSNISTTAGYVEENPLRLSRIQKSLNI
jgi:integrase/recombinase XerD